MKVIKFFDKVEDGLREGFSRWPIVYAMIGGFATILLWRAIWHSADLFQEQGGILGTIFYPINQVFINVIILLAIGLFVSIFVGDHIIISGWKKEKKAVEHTEIEVKEEGVELHEVMHEIVKLQKAIEELKQEAAKK